MGVAHVELERSRRRGAAAGGREEEKKLTGQRSNFASIGGWLADDPIENMKLVLGSKLLTLQWKKLVWLLRARQAMRAERRQFRRHPRWLCGLFAKEVSWMWGHLGAARQALNDSRKGPPLFVGGPVQC